MIYGRLSYTPISTTLTDATDAGAAIHGTFEHLQSVDLALCLSIAPGFPRRHW